MPSVEPTVIIRTVSLRGTVVRARSGFFTVLTPEGEVTARLRGRLKKERQSADIAVIGDVVEVEPGDEGEGSIVAVDERRTKLSRRQPGPRGKWKEDVIVANADQALVVFACAKPEPELRMLDRFLVVAEHDGIDAVVIANKVDLCGDEQAKRIFGVYERVGYPVHYVAAKPGVGVEELRDLLRGKLSVVVGPSGAGKSTLLNAVRPGLQLRTGEVSETTDKGRHTTVVAELLPVDDEGWVADTPGLRELALWEIPQDELAWCFPEFRDKIGKCRFDDCSHVHEPECAIRSAVDAGEIDPGRHESYVRMLAGEER
jgi:ribosome biogenesis GTPase / thiamine phosphate phosphatase